MLTTRQQRGFTLLELLVSLSLTTVVLTILLAGFRLTESAWRRGTERLTAMTQGLAEETTIHAQVSSAIPRQINTQYEQRQLHLVSFRGSAKEVRYLSNYSSQGGRSFGLWLVSYRVVHQSEGKEQLVLSEKGLSSDQQLVDFLMTNQPLAEQTIPLGERADNIELSYFRPSSPGLPAAWVQDWKCDDRKQLPGGLRIQWQTAKQERGLTLPIPVWEVHQ